MSATNETTVDQFFESTRMRDLLRIPSAVLDQAMGKAIALYQAGHFEKTEILCRGLLAADHRYWWAYSLYAAALQAMGRYEEALTQVNLGLRYEPGQPKLVALRIALTSAVEAIAAAPADKARKATRAAAASTMEVR